MRSYNVYVYEILTSFVHKGQAKLNNVRNVLGKEQMGKNFGKNFPKDVIAALCVTVLSLHFKYHLVF